MRKQCQQHAELVVQSVCFKKLLLLGHGQWHTYGNVIKHSLGVIAAQYGLYVFLGHTGHIGAVRHKFVLDCPYKSFHLHRVDLGRTLGSFLHRADEIRFFADNINTLCPVQTLSHNTGDPPGDFEHLLYLSNNACGIYLICAHIIGIIALSGKKYKLAAICSGSKRFNGFLPGNVKMYYHFRENNKSPQSKHGQLLRCRSRLFRFSFHSIKAILYKNLQ